jgi:hypothetical protein
MNHDVQTKGVRRQFEEDLIGLNDPSISPEDPVPNAIRPGIHLVLGVPRHPRYPIHSETALLNTVKGRHIALVPRRIPLVGHSAAHLPHREVEEPAERSKETMTVGIRIPYLDVEPRTPGTAVHVLLLDLVRSTY